MNKNNGNPSSSTKLNLLPKERKSDDRRSLLSGGHDRNVRAVRHDAVDFTPPHLISALITESGVLTPSAVSEELIKIWF